MLDVIAIVLFVAWALGVAAAHTMGGFIHLFLALAVLITLVRLIQGRPTA